MSKKAFTLVELLGVITLLGLIAAIAFPPIVKQLKDSETKINKATEELIIMGAQNYIDDNKNDFPKVDDNIYCITLKKLVNENRVSNNLKDASGNDISLDKYVKINVANNKYNYSIVDVCDIGN